MNATQIEKPKAQCECLMKRFDWSFHFHDCPVFQAGKREVKK